MYLAFIDESGNTHPNDKKNLVYVFSALIMHEKGWNYLHRETKNLKLKIWQKVKEKDAGYEVPDDFELHMKEITGKTGYFKILKDNDKDLVEICDMIYNFISTLYIKIISVIIIKEKFYNQYPEGLNKWAFELLVERVNRYIMSKNSKNDEFVILVLDSAGDKIDDERRKQIEAFMTYGTGHGWKEYPEQVIETPFIVKSKIHNGVQLVNTIAYLIRCYTRKCLGIIPNAFFHKHCDRFMKQIVHLFYGFVENSKYHYINENGIKFFPYSTKIPKNFWYIFS